jgi:saccharopine dehydrogenase (NAD+, L-lysine-forming)
MLGLAAALGVHAVDLASDMYGDEARRSLTFEEYDFDEALRARGATALISLGISPGVTNFLIGLRVHALRAAGRKALDIERIDLDLLEDIDSDELVFSWSPVVALEELAQDPRIIEDGRMVVLEPFSSPRSYAFPQETRPTRRYPLYQEELLSFRRSFPDIAAIASTRAFAESDVMLGVERTRGAFMLPTSHGIVMKT